MSDPIQQFNEKRAARAMSNRSFALGPYTLTRRVSVPPESMIGFRREVEEAGSDDATQLAAAEKVISALCEPWATDRGGDPVAFDEAWRIMRFEGDEYGVLDVRDLMDISRWLVEGMVERPTGQPSDSSDGSMTPPTGTTSMDSSPYAAPALTISTPDGVSTRSMPA